MAWYWIALIITIAWVGLSTLLAGGWSRHMRRNKTREEQTLQGLYTRNIEGGETNA